MNIYLFVMLRVTIQNQHNKAIVLNVYLNFQHVLTVSQLFLKYSYIAYNMRVLFVVSHGSQTLQPPPPPAPYQNLILYDCLSKPAPNFLFSVKKAQIQEDLGAELVKSDGP